MAIDERLKNLRGPGRRQFLKWSTTVAAAIGLPRVGYLNWLNDRAGTAMADSACTSPRPAFFVSAGNGSASYNTLLWPTNAVMAPGASGSYAHPEIGKGIPAQTDMTSYFASFSPWQQAPSNWRMTTFIAGTNQTHTVKPSWPVANGVEVLAAAASIQSATPSLLPVLGISPFNFGTASGAPGVSTVPNAAGLVSLFDSVASKTILSTPSNAALYEAYTKAFLGMNAAAAQTTMATGQNTSKVAANLLGLSLSSKLLPTAAERAMYGVTSATQTGILNMADAFITGLKAMSMGLTMMVILPDLNDDPHGEFSGNPEADATLRGKVYNGVYTHAASLSDPNCSGNSLADRVVLASGGDTTKDPLMSTAWPDNTPGNTSQFWVMGNGALNTGNAGDINADGSVRFWDPTVPYTATTNNSTSSSAKLTTSATAAFLYAICGDMRTVNNFATGVTIDGMIKKSVTLGGTGT